MTVITEEPLRVAYCQCGARLAGDCDQALFEAAQRHIAEEHPMLLRGEAAVGGSQWADAPLVADGHQVGWGR